MPSGDKTYTMKTLQAQITAASSDYSFPVQIPSFQTMDIFRATYSNPLSVPATISVFGLPSGSPIDNKTVPANSSEDTMNDGETIGSLPSGDSPTINSNVSGVVITLNFATHEGSI